MSETDSPTRSYTSSASNRMREQRSRTSESGPRPIIPAPIVPETSTLSPWLDPLRLARCFRIHIVTWAVALGGAAGLLCLIAGAFFFRNTWTLSASLQLVPVSTPFDAQRDLTTYRPPELNPKEMQTLFDQQFVFERLMPMMESGQSLQAFRSLFQVEYTRDAGVYRVNLKNAPSPERAEEILESYFQIIMLTARDLLSARSQKDLDYFKRASEQSERELRLILSRLDTLRRQQGFISLEQEVEAQQLRLGKLEDALQIARSRLSQTQYDIASLPGLIAIQAPEVEIAFNEQTKISGALTIQRIEVRRLESILADDHPQLKAARDQLNRLEADFEKEQKETKQANSAPNPFVVQLNQQFQLAQHQQPQLQREVADLQTRAADVKAYLERLPAAAAQVTELETSKNQQEVLLQRMKSRLEEIEVARSLSLNTVRILDPPSAQNSIKFSRWTKAIIAAAIGCAAGIALASLVAAVRSLTDRKLRTLEDLVQILDAQHVSRLPVEDAKDPHRQRRWLQDICSHLTNDSRRFFVIADATSPVVQNILLAIAEQLGASGMSSVLIAPHFGQDPTGPTPASKGVTQVITKAATLDSSLLAIAPNAWLLPWGDTGDMFDRLPSGEIERTLLTMLRSVDGLQVVLMLPPNPDLVLAQRLGPVAEAILVIADPEHSDGDLFLDVSHAIERPVVMGILTS